MFRQPDNKLGEVVPNEPSLAVAFPLTNMDQFMSQQCARSVFGHARRQPNKGAEGNSGIATRNKWNIDDEDLPGQVWGQDIVGVELGLV